MMAEGTKVHYYLKNEKGEWVKSPTKKDISGWIAVYNPPKKVVDK